MKRKTKLQDIFEGIEKVLVSFRFLYLTKLQYFVCLCFTQMSCSCNFLVHTVGSIDHF
jgi:hypothetical protein